MVEIIPAILPKNFRELETGLEKARGISRMVQIDICDGFFVPSKTFPYVDRDVFEKILREEETMPYWEDFDFEIDMMVNDSKLASEEWVRAGASRLVVHIESPDDRAALMSLQPLRDTYATGIEVVLAIDLDTPIEKLESLANLGSGIQCMGIAHDGFQGQPLDERVYDKVGQIIKQYPAHTISVDGGVQLNNVRKLVDVGVSRLVIGHALFEGNFEDNYRAFENEIA